MNDKIVHLDYDNSDVELLSVYLVRSGVSKNLIGRLEYLTQLQGFLNTLDVITKVILILDGNFPSSVGDSPQFNLPGALKIIKGYREKILGIVVWSAEDPDKIASAIKESGIDNIKILRKGESGKLEPLVQLIRTYLN